MMRMSVHGIGTRYLRHVHACSEAIRATGRAYHMDKIKVHVAKNNRKYICEHQK